MADETTTCDRCGYGEPNPHDCQAAIRRARRLLLAFPRLAEASPYPPVLPGGDDRG